jgi:hypothetical protein
MTIGDLVAFRWPKDDSKTWIEYIGLVMAQERRIHGRPHLYIIREDGEWIVPAMWCDKLNEDE